MSKSLNYMPRESIEFNGQAKASSVTRRSYRFLAGLEGYDAVTLVSHVHPDPDSLGSMVGLAHLIETCTSLPVQITQDGPICRAENKAMVETIQAFRKEYGTADKPFQIHAGVMD